MLKIVISSESVEGKSTLAAIVVQALRAFKIPFVLEDGLPEAGDALHLMADPERLGRNVASIAARESLLGGKVLVVTQQLNRPPTSGE